MANVNIAQLRTLIQGVNPGATVLIHASVLLSVLNQYKTTAGIEVIVPAVTPGANQPPIDLTRF